MNRKNIAAFATVPLLASMLLASPAAMASGGGDGKERSGSCSGSTDWKLKAKHDDGRIEVEFEVDSNQSGQVWDVLITDKGQTVFEGQQTTGGASGSFSVEIKVPNLKGKDKFRAMATNTDGCETCSGNISIR
jgi:hypothetical protein